jgi:hypothetical protein
VVASLAVATFATVLQSHYVINSGGGELTLEAQARSFGDVYGYALVVIVLAALCTTLLRRPRSTPGVSQPVGELVSSAV